MLVRGFVGALSRWVGIIGESDLLRAHVGGGHFVDVRPIEFILAHGDELAGWDAAKAILSLCAPGGTIVQVNEFLAVHPDVGCIDPYIRGWIPKIQPTHSDDDRISRSTARTYLVFAKCSEHISPSAPH